MIFFKAARIRILAASVFLILNFNIAINAQELEPRALTNLPVGTNFIFAGYSYSAGNLLFDPASPIEDASARLNTFVAAYIRSVSLFGISGKVDVVVPYGIGIWEGLVNGMDTATSRSGFADIRFRLSLNFHGAPALNKKEFGSYQPNSISGASIQVFAPTGEYFPERLINLGTNRWTIKLQWGYAKYFEKWIVELYTSMWIFTRNDSFWNGNIVDTKPLYTIKLHGIRKLPNRSWFSLNLGYGIGARSTVNDVEKENRVSTARFGVNYSIPIGSQHTIGVTGTTAVRFEFGADFNAVKFTYNYRW